MKRTLDELTKLGRMDGDGSYITDANSLQGLIDLCKYVNVTDKTMAEVGCFAGMATEVFLIHSPKKYYAVDPWGLDYQYQEANWSSLLRKGGWNLVYTTFLDVINSYPEIDTEVIRNFSINAVQKFLDKSLDLVYIDGWHTKADEDIRVWLPKIKDGGWLTGHDYHQSSWAFDKFSIFKDKEVKTFSDDSWVLQI
jgi:hypothetical protein